MLEDAERSQGLRRKGCLVGQRHVSLWVAAVFWVDRRQTVDRLLSTAWQRWLRQAG